MNDNQVKNAFKAVRYPDFLYFYHYFKGKQHVYILQCIKSPFFIRKKGILAKLFTTTNCPAGITGVTYLTKLNNSINITDLTEQCITHIYSYLFHSLVSTILSGSEVKCINRLRNVFQLMTFVTRTPAFTVESVPITTTAINVPVRVVI